MSTLVKKQRPFPKSIWVYGVISLLCLVFFLVYDQFSHGVHSPYMTFLWAWPFLLGVVPNFLIWLFHFKKPSDLSAGLYNCGVAALTVSSLLKGIFDIAGTASDYQLIMMLIGDVLVAFGLFAYLFQGVFKTRKVIG